jgi:triphosphoribosyl-dephospho-CoA synthase
MNRIGDLEEAIIFTHLTLMAQFPDSLIARKRGREEAAEAGDRAREVLRAGWPDTTAGRSAFAAFDAWLTELGNARNPGTSADLVTACLFATLREREIPDKYEL